MLNKLDRTGNIDSLEDRLWLAANLVSLEEHAYSSYLRTSDRRYIDMLGSFRENRTAVLKDMLGAAAAEQEAELWCMLKHTLGAAMRAYETGGREIARDPGLAETYFRISERMMDAALTIAAQKGVSAPGAGPAADTGPRGNQEKTVIQDKKQAADSDKSKEKKGLFYYLKCCLE